MTINDNVLRKSEKIIFSLRELYLSHGYSLYRMNKFEEYDLYAGNKEFLISDNIITFTDTNGKLMALKPDVTLSIIKNFKDDTAGTTKVFYNENVYRKSKGNGIYQEIMQSGVECFGNLDEDDICEVLNLAQKSLDVLSKNAVIVLSDLDIISSVIDSLTLNAQEKKALLCAIGEKNFHEIDNICKNSESEDAIKTLKLLLSIHGNIEQASKKLNNLSPFINKAVLNKFISVIEKLKITDYKEKFLIDFSVVGDTNYYNGIIFNGFLKNLPDAVVSGGQYDRLMGKMGKKSSAIGFAVYLDGLDKTNSSSSDSETDDYLNVALPKGRLGEKVYELFAKAGYECPALLEPNRKLIFENAEKKVRYFWVKPSDVAIYVERGAADIGVAGKDILVEYNPDIYELLDLKKGKCRMAVAAPKGFVDDTSKTLTVATKFSNIAREFYLSQGRDIDIIHLNGSIEIAPILELSDVIVDIVETGTTLKENDLEVIETIMPISARFIANKSSFNFKSEQILSLKEKLKSITEE